MNAAGLKSYSHKKFSMSPADENQNGQEFYLTDMAPSSIRAETVDITRAASYVDTYGHGCQTLLFHSVSCSVSNISTESTGLLEGSYEKTTVDTDTSQRTLPPPLRDLDRLNDHTPRSKDGSDISAVTDSSATSFSSGGARFKFPVLKVGGLLSRKKRGYPVLYCGAAGVSSDQSPNLSADEQGSLYTNNQDRDKATGSSEGVGSKNEEDKSSLLFRRLNNRLRGRKMTTMDKSPADLDQTTSLEEVRSDDGPAVCQLLSSRYPPRQSMAKRLFSKEDPGPSNVALITVAAVATTAAIVDEIGAIGSSDEAGTSSDCTKRSSFTTTSDLCCKASAAILSGGAKYKLVKEGQIQVCRLNHSRTLLGKLTSSKLLRRWETHVLFLENDEIRSKTPTGFLEQSLKYVHMEDVHALPQWDSSRDRFCVRIFVPEGSVLLQTNRAYSRNQWLYSIQWRRNMFRYRRIIESNCNRPEVLLKELTCMVEQALCSPLQASNLNLKPIKLACLVLEQINDGKWPKTMTEPVIGCVAPLLDTITVIAEISHWLSKHCQECPKSRVIDEVLVDVTILTLKKNMDFGKYTSARMFVQNFVFALSAQNDGIERVKAFVRRAHGLASTCPHPRVLSNLASVCLAAVHALYDSSSYTPTLRRSWSNQGGVPPSSETECSLGESSPLLRKSAGSVGCNSSGSVLSSPSASSLSSSDPDINRQAILNATKDHGKPKGSELQEFALKRLSCLAAVFETMSEFEDWRSALAPLLQPIPFPDDVLSQEAFLIPFSRLIRRIGIDSRCDVHLAVLGVREGKEGWFHLFCPGGPACVDDGDLYASLLKTLLHCCCRRKKFLTSLNSMMGPLQLLALRECEPALEALCRMLEMEVVVGKDLKLQMITALQSTPAGRAQYAALCDRQIALRELQQKGGPRKLTLPSKSTDADLAVLLSSGSFGNLEWLSLAFTNVTSACAEYLIKLPALRYLNLWSTQFGDVGVQLISEHLHKLQVLNLCETPVTDKGLSSLSSLTNLRKLNLNSTRLSAKTFHMLRAKLPALQEADVRYTDAWCSDEFLVSS